MKKRFTYDIQLLYWWEKYTRNTDLSTKVSKNKDKFLKIERQYYEKKQKEATKMARDQYKALPESVNILKGEPGKNWFQHISKAKIIIYGKNKQVTFKEDKQKRRNCCNNM